MDLERRFIWRTVPTVPYRGSVERGVELEAADHDVRVDLSYRVLSLPGLMERLVDIFVPTHRDRDDDLARELDVRPRTSNVVRITQGVSVRGLLTAPGTPLGSPTLSVSAR